MSIFVVTLAALLAVGAVGAAAILGVAVAALHRRPSWPYLLVAPLWLHVEAFDGHSEVNGGPPGRDRGSGREPIERFDARTKHPKRFSA